MAFFNIAAAVATVAGTAVSIQGQRASAKQAQYAADWNADQAMKQAKYDEGIAQENMRRKRDNNRRELARRRASAARGGLVEAGAVTDSLVETSDRLQQDVDDIWERAAANASTLEGQANMSRWQGDMAQQTSKYNIYGTALKGVSSVAGSLYDAHRNTKGTADDQNYKKDYAS